MTANLRTLTKEKRELPMTDTRIAAGNSAHLAARMKAFGVIPSQLIWGILACCFIFLSSQLSHATGTCTTVSEGSIGAPPGNNTVLMLATTLTASAESPGDLCTSLEAVQAMASPLNLNVEIDEATAWGAKSTAQFATYRAIVLGDPDCVAGTGPITEAESTKPIWGPAITGPVAVVGTDPVFHFLNGTASIPAVAAQLTQNAIAFAVSTPGSPGAYICLSCYYAGATSPTTVNVLQPFGTFTVLGIAAAPSTGCTAPSYIVDPINPVVTTPIALPNDPVANTGLSGWDCSAHEGFTNNPLPTNFSAAVRTGNSTPTGLNLPYIITTQPTQTQTLGPPGTTATFTFDTDTYKFTPLNNTGLEQLTVSAVPIPQSSFSAGSLFPNETCVPYKDYSDSAGVRTCVLFHVVCSGTDCSTIIYTVATGYDLPLDLAATGIGGPDFLKASNQPCPPPGNFFDQSIFLSYNADIKDPTTKGGSGTPSCFVATYTPGATPIITTGTVSVNSYFVGFFPPIDNTPTLNTAKAGSTIPIIWELFDASNNPITPTSGGGLTYCTGTCGAGTVMIQFVPTTSGTCSAAATTDPVAATTSSQSGLQFVNGMWQFNAQTKNLSKGCYRLEVSFPTGTTQPGPVHTALFSFK